MGSVKKTVKAASQSSAVKAKAKSPAAAPKKGAVKPAEKPKAGKGSFKKEMMQKLVAEKTKMLEEVTQKVKSESNVHKFEIGDIYDIASTERDRELNLTLGDRDREKLSEIKEALERLRDNTYGLCEECGEPIAENRLRIVPFTRVCVECQSRNEREQRIKGKVEEESGFGILEKGETEEEEF